MLKCSDLQQRSFAMCYITKRALGASAQQFHRSLRDLISTGTSFPRPREQRAALFFLKISILTSEPKSGIHREPDVALFRFKVGDFRFFLRDCQRPAGAGRATCGRGSHDLRARVADNVPKRNGNDAERDGDS